MVLSPEAAYPINQNMNTGIPRNAMVTANGTPFRPQAAIPASGWGDLQVAAPLDPRLLITYATLGATFGTFVRSTNALQAAWVASTIPGFTGNNTKVVSLDTTDAATTVDCTQWTFSHQMVNVAANIPPILKNTAYVRMGAYNDNQLEIDLGGTTWNNVQITFFQNLATSGQFLNGATGSIPAILIGNGFTGLQVLHVNLIQLGVYHIALIMQNSGSGAWSVFPMEWVVLP